jgi:hypothetical protein
MIGILMQGYADFADGGIDAVFGINKHVFSPQPLHDLLASDDTSILFGQQNEQFHGDVFELHNAAVAPQLEAGAVDLELAKVKKGRGHHIPPTRAGEKP